MAEEELSVISSLWGSQWLLLIYEEGFVVVLFLFSCFFSVEKLHGGKEKGCILKGHLVVTPSRSAVSGHNFLS